MTAQQDSDLHADSAQADRHGPPSRLRDRLREQTQMAILDAAERTITEEGTAHARIDAIAAAAGVSVGTLYNHFADRDALVAAVIQDRRRELSARASQLIAEPNVRFEAKLHAFFELYAQAGAKHRGFFGVVMGEQGGLRAWHCQRDEAMVAWFALSRELLLQGVREGVLSGEGLDVYTTLLTGLIRTAVIGPVAGLVAVQPADLAHFFLHGASLHRHTVLPDDGSSL
jgi:AcrR family transcriptional regulator